MRTGAEGVGTTTISGGATATWGRANIGVEGTGTVNVTGTGSVLNVGDIDIGEDVGTGTLNISDGAVVNQTGGNPVVIAEDDASTGTLNIGGPGAPMARRMLQTACWRHQRRACSPTHCCGYWRPWGEA